MGSSAADLLAPFRADPAHAALLFDVDGVLAPIVAHPSDSAVPDEALALLRRLVAGYGLVGCISGRPLAVLRELVPVDGLLYAGNHGVELDVGDGPALAPGADAAAAVLAGLARGLAPEAEALGAWVEDKGVGFTLHWREAPDPVEAERTLWDRARAAVGDRPVELRPARMALELRPRLPVDKGTAVRALLAARPCRRSLFVGDDVTDVDAFRQVDTAIAVRSPESPAALLEAADLVIDDVPSLLAELARDL